MPLTIDFTHMMSPAVKGGLTEQQWREAAPAFAAAHQAVVDKHSAGTLGFLDLPDDDALVRQSIDFAKRAKGTVDDVVVCGIGGSALGPIALRTALVEPGWNLLPADARGGFPRLHVLDNVDPATMHALLARLDLARTLFIVTSKSGGTAETMAQYLIVRERLDEALGARGKERLVFVTDPKKGSLRPLAQAEGIPALDIPANVGGRFSVLTPVGLLPAALIGIDVRGLLGGASDIRTRSSSKELSKNVAGTFAVLQWLADTTRGRHVQVLMPYVDALRDFAAWYVQLWAESLGKIRKDGRHVGPTPLGALGATDQHSQVQLFMEGPADKTVCFVGVHERPEKLPIPKLHADVPSLAYLGGHSLGELIDVEQRATAGALASRGALNFTMTLDRVDARHVGELIMLLELATAYAGELYGVDAFDQPGVELGKQFAYALLGRPDADPSVRAEFEAIPKPDPRWQL
jgi:glucose-6-phosphate isomerase